jgi:hypothetical protein
MRLPAEIFSMLGMNAPYTEIQSCAMPLGENRPQRGGAPCGRASQWFRSKGDLLEGEV